MKYLGAITNDKDLITKEYVDTNIAKTAVRPNLLDNWYFVAAGASLGTVCFR